MQAVLQAFAQVPDIHVYYGPDTYMGRNLAVMLRSVSQLSDEEISALHPAHNRATVKVRARIQPMTAGSNETFDGPCFLAACNWSSIPGGRYATFRGLSDKC